MLPAARLPDPAICAEDPLNSPKSDDHVPPLASSMPPGIRRQHNLNLLHDPGAWTL